MAAEGRQAQRHLEACSTRLDIIMRNKDIGKVLPVEEIVNVDQVEANELTQLGNDTTLIKEILDISLTYLDLRSIITA